MIPVLALLTYRYKKYSYSLPAGIHLQYSLPTRCRFYPRIFVSTDIFDIPKLNHYLNIFIIIYLG